MARTKEYDRDMALERAMMLFWAQGYTATSVQQLLVAMGISRSSMYTEFGNKRDLFLESLSLYNSLTNVLIDTISKAVDPVEAVRGFYEIGFYRQPEKLLYRGCLIINSILELRDVDNELSSIASGYINEMEHTLAICFRKCIACGTLHKDLNPEVLASFYLTVIKGMRVAVRQNQSEEYLRGVIETALLVLTNSNDNKTQSVSPWT